MRYRWALLWAALTLFSSSALAQHTYYISKSAGSDSNSATQAQSKATPWAHLPGMNSCASNCASYSPVAGDHFILKGGDTWVAADLGVNWQWSGTSSNPIYIGVDQTWYAGSSWARPIWTCGGGTCSGSANAMLQIGGGSNVGEYTTWDNIEMTDRGLSDDRGFIQGYADYITVENVYIHGWNHTGEGADNGFGITLSTCCGGSGVGDVIDHVVIDGSDTTKDSLACFYGQITKIQYSLCNWTTNGAEGAFDQIHDSLFENIPTSWASGTHQNAVQQAGPASSSSNAFAYNNLITGVQAGGITKLWMGQATGGSPQTAYVFNNVLASNVAGNDVDNCQEGSNCGTSYYFNNTFECGNSSGVGDCMAGSGSGPTQVTHWINNHCIATSCVNVTSDSNFTVTETNDLLQSVSAASAQGYTAGSTYAFQPTSSSGGTVGAGTNEQSLCTTINGIDTTAGSACKNSTGYACSYNTSSHTLSCPAASELTRPTSAAWDIGAYQYSSGGGGGSCSITTSSPLPDGTNGTPYNQTLTETGCGSSTWSVSSGSLPPVLNLNASNGEITGTPTAAGTYSFTATIGAASKTLEIVVASPSAPTINSFTASPSTIISGSSSSLAWSVTGATSLSINQGVGTVTTGPVSVSPTSTTTYTLTATNGNGSSTATVTVTLASCAITTSSPLPNGTQGTAYSRTLAESGCPASSWAATGLPAGMSINASSGLLSGTPTASGTFSLGVTYATASSTLSLTILSSCVITTGSPLPSGTQGTPYSQTLAASGCSSSTWSETGSLPAGLTLSSSGVLSGTPSAPGSSSFTASYADASKVFNLTINGIAPVISAFSASPSSINVGSSSTLSWTVSGATSLSINQGVGTVTGSSVAVSPTATKTYTLTATNSYGSSTANAAITVSSAATSGITTYQIKATFRHGSDVQVQTSDGTGGSGHLAMFDSGGGLTDGGAAAPASSSSTCSPGQFAWDSTYIYVCVAANTWMRTPLQTF